ncbi:hypothetical protein [Fervidobacterium thailandense]|uniref:Uncharacterized protein n=1 Tax=Fervidobacterium thailandense TaxID=1008305 RepID=A0A1E3G3A6_9BACT|nr:hypothetical protein [Fervidobacterium thailandense]ODN30717.1 hypothetical protein A4H02_04095 [Fervidobacterium thailandense]
MKKLALTVIGGFTVVLAVTLLLNSCAAPVTIKDFRSEISEPNKVPISDPAYLVNILGNEEFTKMISEMGYIPNANRNEGFILGNLADSAENFLEDFIDKLEKNERRRELVRQMIEYRKAVEKLLTASDRYEYLLKLDGEAKKQIEKSFGVQVSTELYVDFRDVLYFYRSWIEPIVFIYEHRAELRRLLEEYKNLKQSNIEKYFTKQFLELLNLLKTGDRIDLDILSKAFLELAAVKSPPNELGISDIFTESFLVRGGIDLKVRFLDHEILYLVEIFEFESSMLDDKGERKDKKVTILSKLRWRFFLTEPFLVKSWGEKTLGSLLFNIVSGEFQLGNLTVDLKTTKIIEVLKELNKILPDKTLKIVFRAADSKSGYIEILINFGYLARSKTINLGDNNITIKTGLFTRENLEQIKSMSNSLEKVLLFVDKYCDFFDIKEENGTKLLRVDIKIAGTTNPAFRILVQFKFENLESLIRKTNALKLLFNILRLTN